MHLHGSLARAIGLDRRGVFGYFVRFPVFV